ncbi:hypothetical protein ACTXT7_016382 [Hymenolepis weldensis]
MFADRVVVPSAFKREDLRTGLEQTRISDQLSKDVLNVSKRLSFLHTRDLFPGLKLQLFDTTYTWPEVIPLNSTTTTRLIGSLRHIFPIHGLLKTILTDNGIQFSSALFQDICWSHNVTTSPLHHINLKQMDSTFPTSPSCAKKTLTASTAVYVLIHRPSGTWSEGIIRARGGSLPYEANIDGQTWVRHHSHLCPLCAAKSSNLETGPLDIILDV